MSLLDDKCDLCDSVCLNNGTSKANEMRLWCGECGLDRVKEVKSWLAGEGDPPTDRDEGYEGTVIRVHPKVVQVLTILGVVAVASWWMMLILGAVHSEYPAITALPYWVVLLGFFGLRCVLAVVPNAAHFHDAVDE